MNRITTVAMLALVLLSLVQAAWQHGRLPATVASHFDGSGKVNGWMPRGTQTAWHLGTVLFMAAMFEGLVRLIARIPDEYINIPHRDYWLAPARRSATVARLGTLVRLTGCVVLLFFVGLFHQVYRVNTGGSDITPAIALLSGVMLVVVLAILGATLFRFSRPPAS